MKPILFSTPMVQAILADNKNQTRRVMKPQPVGDKFSGFAGQHYAEFRYNNGVISEHIELKYHPGDILWVREAWGELKDSNHEHLRYVYKTDGYPYEPGKYIVKFNWKPSIFMPREAARIFLRVTDVRVERLQKISEADVNAEGFRGEYNIQTDVFRPAGFMFKGLWNRFNTKRGYGWDVNPWVEVVEFKREVQSE